MAYNERVTTGAAAVAIISASTRLRGSLVLRNEDATNDIVLGGPGVTASGATAGVTLKAGATLVVPATAETNLYAIAVAGTPVLEVLVVG